MTRDKLAYLLGYVDWDQLNVTMDELRIYSRDGEDVRWIRHYELVRFPKPRLYQLVMEIVPLSMLKLIELYELRSLNTKYLLEEKVTLIDAARFAVSLKQAIDNFSGCVVSIL